RPAGDRPPAARHGRRRADRQGARRRAAGWPAGPGAVRLHRHDVRLARGRPHAREAVRDDRARGDGERDARAQDAGAGGLVERGGEPRPRRRGQRVVDAELVQDSDDDAPDVVAVGPRGPDRADEDVEGAILAALVEGGERGCDVRCAGQLEPDARGEAVRGEAAADVLEDAQRLLELAAVAQDAGQGNRGVGTAGVELEGLAERRLVPLAGELLGLRGNQGVEEARHHGAGLGADELGDDATVAEGLDRGNALDAVRLSEPGVGVDVELRQLDGAVPAFDLALEHWPEDATRSAPSGPEVDHDRHLARALDDRRLECRLAYVHGIELTEA